MIGLHSVLAAALALQSAPAVPSVAGFAAHLQEDLPRQFDDYRIVSARAEGDVLVFTFDGRRGWRGPQTNVDLASEIMGHFCEDDFRQRIGLAAVRVDTLDQGRDLIQGTPVVDCPQARCITSRGRPAGIRHRTRK